MKPSEKNAWGLGEDTQYAGNITTLSCIKWLYQLCYIEQKKQEIKPKLVTFSVVFDNLLYMIKYELALKLKSFLNIRVKVIKTVESKHN